MAPEIEGKPGANMGTKMVEVPYEALLDIENYTGKMLKHLEDVISSDIMSSLPFDGDKNNSEPKDSGSAQLNWRPESLRAIAEILKDVKTHSELVHLKVQTLIIPRQKVSEEDASAADRKRSRPPPQLHVPRVPGVTACPLDSKSGVLADGGVSQNGTAFEVASPTTGPLKYIRTSDNTKAAYQKPSTIFMPTAKVGGLVLDASNVPAASGEAAAVGLCRAPKRPSRCRRDRNRTRNKIVAVAEPIMQKLKPGDTNKIPDDGYLWRKYGNKPIKTASYKRGYYKCRHYKEVHCMATKIVQQTNNDPSTFSVSYKGEHICKQQGNLGAGRPQSGDQLDSNNSSLGDQVNELENHPNSPGETEKEDLFAPDGLEWPRDDVTSDSASDDLFAAAEHGEEAVDSATRPPLDPPASPLIDFDISIVANLPTTEDIDTQSSPWDEPLRSPPTGDLGLKPKYHQPIETCKPEGADGELVTHEEDSDALLRMINGGLSWDSPSNINYLFGYSEACWTDDILPF